MFLERFWPKVDLFYNNSEIQFICSAVKHQLLSF